MNAASKAANWFKNLTSIGKKRLAVSALALALAGSFATYEFTQPASAKAAAAAPAAGPLDDNSVGALLAVDRAMETLAARVTPAVVNVAVTSKGKQDQMADQLPEGMRRFFQGQPGQGGPGGMGGGMNGDQFGQFFGQRMRPRAPEMEHGIGSGVVISPDGYIVTNNHVIDGATDIRVTTSNRRVLKAKLIGADPLTDLAVIKVEAANLDSVSWADMADVRQGATVLAFGNPYGFRFTVTRGIVSAVNRPNPDASDPRKPGQFIQTDAAINPGNSGGPLVDARGQIVGINTFLISPSGSFSGMGFAIPAKLARPIVETLIRDGKVNHSRIGVGIADVTPENAKFFDDSNMAGAVITQVEDDSPGDKAGLKIGDVIVELDGKHVSDAGELQAMISQRHPGEKVELQVLRDGKKTNVAVTLEAIRDRSDDDRGDSHEGSGKMRWGLGLGELTPDIRDQIQAPRDLRGAVVERVQPGSSADNAQLQPGDVILEVNRQKVESAADVQKALGGVEKGKDALVLVWSNGGNSFRVLHSPEGA